MVSIRGTTLGSTPFAAFANGGISIVCHCVLSFELETCAFSPCFCSTSARCVRTLPLFVPQNARQSDASGWDGVSAVRFCLSGHRWQYWSASWSTFFFLFLSFFLCANQRAWCGVGYPLLLRICVFMYGRWSNHPPHVRYIMRFPRRCSTHLFPGTETRWLAICFLMLLLFEVRHVLNFVMIADSSSRVAWRKPFVFDCLSLLAVPQWTFFAIFDRRAVSLASYSSGQFAMIGFFQAGKFIQLFLAFSCQTCVPLTHVCSMQSMVCSFDAYCWLQRHRPRDDLAGHAGFVPDGLLRAGASFLCSSWRCL